MKKVVLFDIDYTLFNGKKYREILFNRLAEIVHYKDSKEEFITRTEEVYLNMRETLMYFDPKIYADALEHLLKEPIDKEEIIKVCYDRAILDAALYEEIFTILEQLSEDSNITLGVLSTGLGTLQSKKIEKIIKYFDQNHVHVDKNKYALLPELMEKYKLADVFLIDDVMRVLADAKKLNPKVKTIWIKRGRLFDKFPVEGFTPDLEVEDLLGIVDFIKNN